MIEHNLENDHILSSFTQGEVKTLTIAIAVITISSIAATTASTTLVVTLVISTVTAIIIATRTTGTTSITYNISFLSTLTIFKTNDKVKTQQIVYLPPSPPLQL